MSKGIGDRNANERDGKGEQRAERTNSETRSSRSSVRMTADRARAIQAQADQTSKNQGFKGRAMSAADRNTAGSSKGTPDDT